MLLSSDPLSVSADWRGLGIAASLTKPIRPSDLLEAILTALHLRLGAAGPAPPAPPPAPGVGRRLRVLLAEDNAVNQRLVAHLLGDQGHEVVVAGNGREALDALDRGRFDVVLMDVQMPEVDGFEATAALRSRERVSGRHTPVLALTAHALKGDRDRCLAAGMDGYVSKPIRSEELFQALRELAPPSAPPAAGAPAGDGEGRDVFDRAAALAGAGGNASLLREIAGLFREDSPRLLAAVRAAIDGRDALRLRRAVHTLRGSVANFAAGPAVEAARRLEAMGEANDLGGAAEAYRALEREVRRLEQALAGLALPPAPA
jgi:CheY-like chemotaxis protein/HPt (histidine-containing phosphotransfer) domain-containing protein